LGVKDPYIVKYLAGPKNQEAKNERRILTSLKL
jgi:hypothetical protein